jgi:PAS domain S-box-containing protein
MEPPALVSAVPHLESVLRDLVASAPDALIVEDHDGRIVIANRQTEALFGYRADELLGQPVELLIPERFRAAHVQHRARYREAPQPRPMGAGLDLWGRRKDGSEFAVEVSLSPIRTADRLLIASSIRDISDRRLMEHALRESEQRFHMLFDEALELIFLLAPDGTVLEANQAALGFAGQPRELVVGHVLWENALWREPAGGDRAHRLRTAVERAAAGSFDRFEMQHRDLTGRTTYHDVSVKPAREARGTVTQIIVVCRDISARKQAEMERDVLLARERTARAEALAAAEMVRRLQSVTDSAMAAMAVPAMQEELLLRLRIALAADTAMLLLLTEDGQALAPVAASGLGTQPLDEEHERVPLGRGIAGGVAASRAPRVVEDVRQVEVVSRVLRERVRSLMAVPLLVNERLLGVLHVGTTLPRRFTEEDVELLRLAAERIALALDHARLFSAEQRARAEAEAALHLRDEMLALVTHDLGQPLSSIRVATQLLRRALTPGPEGDGATGDTDAADGGWLVAIIEDEATRMAALVSELLDTARLQSGAPLDLRYRPTDLVALAKREVRAVQQTAPEHRVALQTHVNELIGEWDQERLQRVLRNLLSNAVKYSPAGSTVTVTLTSEDADDRRWARLAVQDEGIGIPAEDLPLVFERFHRGRNTAGSAPGTGLGLAGARQIVELHGGRITIASVEGRGTTVTVWLPLA